MNKKEHEIICGLVDLLRDQKSEHPLLYATWDILSALARNETSVAKRILKGR